MGLRQHLIPLGLDSLRLIVEYLVRSQRVEGAMPMAGVVPRYKPRTERPRFIQRAEAFRIRDPALECREQAFDKGIVVADMRATSGDSDLELVKHFHQVRLFHRASVVGMNGQKRRIRNPMSDCIGQYIPRQKPILTDFHSPRDKLAAEKIHECIEVAEAASNAQSHRRNVPTPDTVDCFGFQLTTAAALHHQRRTRFHGNESVTNPVEARRRTHIHADIQLLRIGAAQGLPVPLSLLSTDYGNLDFSVAQTLVLSLISADSLVFLFNPHSLNTSLAESNGLATRGLAGSVLNRGVNGMNQCPSIRGR